MTKLSTASLLSIFMLTGCGGGGGGDASDKVSEDSASVTYSNYTITAIDGYLEKATAWVDSQNTGRYNDTNPSAVTDHHGKATLSIPNNITVESHAVFVEAKKSVTFDHGLGSVVLNDFTLVAPAGEKNVTPFSTLVYLKMQAGLTKEAAIEAVAKQLQVSDSRLLSDFIAIADTRMTLIAEDLVRLNVFPESPELLAQVSRDQTALNADLAQYALLQHDLSDFVGVARNTEDELEIDTDRDGTADSDDGDIDGDMLPNEDDDNPYIVDLHNINNPSALLLSQIQNETLLAGQWHYYRLDTPEDILLNVGLTELTGDVDLYVKQGGIPTQFDYDCRSNNSYQLDETCLQRLTEGQVHYIGVTAQDNAQYRLQAVLDDIVISKVSLLLHGLASDASTWNNMVNDDRFYSGACPTLNIHSEITALPQVNNQGESCFRLNFGGYDRDTYLRSTGLDGKTCVSALGCNGDYSRFELLGREVEAAVGKIVEKLGVDTEIALLGHSRGGLAARAYLQGADSQHKAYVKALATTGTPHQGSPLGRFYQYMDDNCTPKSRYRQDGSVCEDSWEVIELIAGDRKFLGVPIGKKIMDLHAPSIDFLSPESVGIIELNANILSLENVAIAQLSYKGTEFGLLAKDVKLFFDYDLYSYFSGIGDHPHPSTLRYIEQGATRESLIGDGIVPAYSQKLSNVLEPYGRDVDVSLQSTADKIIHTEQTRLVSDLNLMFDEVRPHIGWQ